MVVVVGAVWGGAANMGGGAVEMAYQQALGMSQ